MKTDELTGAALEMTREEMIYALTLFELEYMMDYPESVQDVARFLAEGGFGNETDEKLRERCKDNVLPEGA